MKVYLTSSPTIMDWDLPKEKAVAFNESNDFLVNLKKDWKKDSKVLFISSAPDDAKQTDDVRDDFVELFPKYDLSFSAADVLDNRNIISEEELLAYQVIILCGGHAPTQNSFFTKIGLKRMLKDFEGIVIGISAGTMNCADLVYALPELEGESEDLFYKRYLPGLGLTDINVIPHWQCTKEAYLDGKKLYDEIIIPDSYNHIFYGVCDGSYILIDEDGNKSFFGEIYEITSGEIKAIN